MVQFGGPIDPQMVLGAFPIHEGQRRENTGWGGKREMACLGVPDDAKAQVLIISISINNHCQGEELAKALLWEKHFLHLMKTFRSDWFEVQDRAERSIEDEIERGSQSDTETVVISCLIIFVYFSTTLARIRHI